MMPAFFSLLLQQGLGLITNAVLVKGKEWVEEKAGVKLDQPISQEDIIKLKQFEIENEQMLIKLRIEEKGLDLKELTAMLDAAKSEDANVTSRWSADMAGDSVLAKNIRPATLIYILTAYLVFAGLSAAGISVQETYVSLLGQWGMLVMTAYFGGRTVEKIMEITKGKNK